MIQNLQMSLIPQTNFLVGTFFAVSYNKPALTSYLKGSSLKSALKLDVCKQITKSRNFRELLINFPLKVS